MSDNPIVWSDEHGDLRKKNKKEARQGAKSDVDEQKLILELRRLTSGKGRTVIEIKGLPDNKKWCQKLAKDLKKKIGVGGAYKDHYIEIHGEKFEQVIVILDSRQLKWKKVGG